MLQLNELNEQVRSFGGQIFAITAQKDCSVEKDWRLQFPVRIDAQCATQKSFRLAITERAGYEHGMSQPGIVVLRHVTKDDENKATSTTTSMSMNAATHGLSNLEQCEILYYWRIEPSTMNFGGGSDRPILSQVMNLLMSRLQSNDENNSSQLEREDQQIETIGKAVRLRALDIYFQWGTWKYLLMPCCSCCCCYGSSDDVLD